MIEIKLYIDMHNNEERLFADFKYDVTINKLIRSIQGAKWSQSKKRWHFNVDKKVVKSIDQKIKGLAVLDTSYLKQQLLKRKMIISINKEISIKDSPKFNYPKKTNYSCICHKPSKHGPLGFNDQDIAAKSL